MKIVVAMDSFKDSLTAPQVCAAVAEALRSALPEAEVVVRPMADGGEGTGAVLRATGGGEWIERQVTGPLPEMQVDAGFVWLSETRTAVVEMAAASGLERLRPEQRDPLKTTTYGTGQLIGAALETGAACVLLAVGGSATVDGGVGAATALGWDFLTRDGRPVALGGAGLGAIERIVPPRREVEAVVEVLCDVDNPLCGPHGAAAVYGPQKGATPEVVKTLEAGLRHLAALVDGQLGRRIGDLPGAGAAGGLAGGAVAFLNARLVSGIDEVMRRSRLREEAADADWIITGEGRFDHQSLRGKVVSGVTRVARRQGAKVAVIAGQVLLGREAVSAAGIDVAVPCMTEGMDLEYALAHGATVAADAARRLAGEWLRA